MNVSTIGTLGITFFIILISIIYYCYYTGSIFNRSLKERECKYVENVYGDLNGTIQPASDASHPLYDYYIKSAYNCCSPGTYRNDYVDLCCLKAVLKQGVRGLDMEIFSLNDQPIVATSTTDDYHIKETFNYLSFTDVLNCIRDYAFSGQHAPNYAEPIILHLRCKSNNAEMYKNFAKILKEHEGMLLGNEYSYESRGQNLGAKPLSTFKGKVVVVADRQTQAMIECKEFMEYVNLCSNNVFMRALHFSDIKYSPDQNELTEFNKTGMTIGMPDRGADPENPSAVVMRECGVQMIAMRYSLVDTGIEECDAFFAEEGAAFVLKPERLRYQQVTVPDPPAQTPEVSFGTRTIKTDYYQFNI